MPKVKTKRAAAKRFKRTGGSVIRRGSAFRRHILTSKTTKRKRQLRAAAAVDISNLKAVLRILPNG
jgi:large subunit ribosomal protein L35